MGVWQSKPARDPQSPYGTGFHDREFLSESYPHYTTSPDSKWRSVMNRILNLVLGFLDDFCVGVIGSSLVILFLWILDWIF